METNVNTTLLAAVAAAVLPVAVEGAIPSSAPITHQVSTTNEPIAPGKFEPTWESLQQYQVPDWFRDAKFGIWAHWGPQCQPEAGDWYARGMYIEGDHKYQVHLQKYGRPSKFGFKDVIHEWKAENWDPQKLVALYKRAGAKYFFAMANHHDNLDMWDSKYQPWNSVRVGPQKDIIAGWEKAARDNGLPFGVSVHAAHAWSWYETSQGADKKGEFAGIHYDGMLTKADGKGQWWDGLDPQDLYAQAHKPGRLQWEWDPRQGSSTPDLAYCQKFYDRTMDLINQHHPDLIYFDDTALPLFPVSDAGLKIAAHFYNDSIKRTGELKGVLFGKVLDEEQRKCMAWDIERGASNRIEPLPWQTDTCIGGWHYDRPTFEHHHYKSAKTVIHMLVDIVSKNGNLLLNVPVRGDGTIDEDELKVVQGITAWMDQNSESIYATRPWKIFGEGPATEGAPIKAQGFNEGKGKAMGAEDVRFVTKGDTLYATIMGWPTGGKAVIHALGSGSPQGFGKVAEVTMLGSNGTLKFEQTDAGLTVTLPAARPNDIACVLKILPQK
jgi:alpha-L-fucosidase